MQVILTEKPSVAKDICKVLSVNGKGDGYFHGNGYYVTWAFGHLVELAPPETYDKALKKWNLNTLPIVPSQFKTKISSIRGVKKQFNTIKTLFNQNDIHEIICATDAGREGELIFRYIYEKTRCKKPFKRLWISSQTDLAIRQGFSQLQDGRLFDTLYYSAISRSEADWLVGINATRLYTLKHSTYKEGVMSVGRVQTPVLRLIVERHLEIENFTPEKYYQISVTFHHEKGGYKGTWFHKKEDRFKRRDEALALTEEIKKIVRGVIHKVVTKEKKERPPYLYDLTSLQKDAHKRYKYSADKTLKLAQSLYEKHKLITYPRTSSRFLSTDIKPQLPQLVNNLSHIPEYQQITQFIQSIGIHSLPRVFNNSKVTDHHAIIPTDKVANLVTLSRDEQNIFQLITKRFLSVFLDDCIKELTEIISQLDNHTFRSRGTVIRHEGWKVLYPPSPKKKKDDTEEEDQNLPPVQQGDPIQNIDTQLQEKQTKPPKMYNDASILAAMETAGKKIDDEELREAMKDSGLGTPATRAQIIERLISVKYVKREKNKLTPTPKGITLISIVNKDISSAEMTGQWEKKLSDIREGKYNRNQFMSEIAEKVNELVSSVIHNSSSKVATPLQSGRISTHAIIGKCPRCGGEIIEGKRGYGCSQWKSKNCSFVIWKIIAGIDIPKEQVFKILQTGRSDQITDFRYDNGEKFSATLEIINGELQYQNVQPHR